MEEWMMGYVVAFVVVGILILVAWNALVKRGIR